MRTWILALVAAALPVALYLPLIDAAAPGAGVSADPGGRWVALGLVVGSALLLFLGFRVTSGGAGPALAASLGLSLFPSIPDAVGSAAWIECGAVGALGLLMVVLLHLGRSRTASGPVLVLTAVAILLATMRSPLPHPVRSLSPSTLLAGIAGVLAGIAATTMVRRGDLPARTRGFLVAGLASALAASAFLGQVRARSWQDPADFWERAVAASPDNPAALGASAGLRAEAGDLPGAEARLRAFVQAVDARGKELGFGEDVRRAGAEGAVRAAARLLREKRGEEELLAKALQMAEALGPRIGAVRRALGEARLELGEFAEARRHLEQAVREDSTDAAAWDALARTHLALADLGPALEAAARAAGLRPRDARCVSTYARALLAVRRDGEALQVLRDALGQPPYNPAMARAYADAHLEVAGREVSRGLKGRALRRVEAGLEVDEAHAGCKALRDRLRAEYDAERPEAEKLMKDDAGGSVPLVNWRTYAAWLCQWGDYRAAEPHYAALLQRFGSLAEVHYDYGHEFWEKRGTLEGYEKAVEAYRDALARDEKFVEARNRLWQCLLVLGRRERAVEEARRFYDLAPSHPDAFDAQQLLEGR